MSRQTIAKGLYTTPKGGKVVLVFDCYLFSFDEESYVDFEDVRTGNQDEIPLSEFKKKYPHKVDKLEVEFKEVAKVPSLFKVPAIWNLYTDKSGRSIVYVFDTDVGWWNNEDGETIFLSVKSGKEGRLSWSEFNKRYPHKIEKILIEFS